MPEVCKNSGVTESGDIAPDTAAAQKSADTDAVASETVGADTPAAEEAGATGSEVRAAKVASPSQTPEPSAQRRSAGDWWLSIARARYMPPPVRKFAVRMFGRWSMSRRAKNVERRDRRDNARTRLPVDENVWMPALWITELYTPTTLSGLLQGLPRLMDRYKGLGGEDDVVQWVRDHRRGGQFGSHDVAIVYSKASDPGIGGRIIDQLPLGIESVELSLHAVTSTVTAVVAGFHLDRNFVKSLEHAVNRDAATRLTKLRGGGHSEHDVWWQKHHTAEAWRQGVRHDTSSWLTSRLPGFFSHSDGGQLPTLELLLTARQLPWEGNSSSQYHDNLRRFLDLGSAEDYWQCTTIPALRLRERRSRGAGKEIRHVVTLAALRAEFLAGFQQNHGPGRQRMTAALFQLGQHISSLAVRWALTSLVREVDEHLADQADRAAGVSTSRSPRTFNKIQREVTRTGLDGRIVLHDVARYAEDPFWKFDVLDFDMVPAPTPANIAAPATSLIETLRTGQIKDVDRIVKIEAELRELLGISADLRAVSLNLTLQWLIATLTVLIMVAGGVAAWPVVNDWISPAPTSPAPTSTSPSPPPQPSSSAPRPPTAAPTQAPNVS